MLREFLDCSILFIFDYISYKFSILYRIDIHNDCLLPIISIEEKLPLNSVFDICSFQIYEYGLPDIGCCPKTPFFTLVFSIPLLLYNKLSENLDLKIIFLFF